MGSHSHQSRSKTATRGRALWKAQSLPEVCPGPPRASARPGTAARPQDPEVPSVTVCRSPTVHLRGHQHPGGTGALPGVSRAGRARTTRGCHSPRPCPRLPSAFQTQPAGSPRVGGCQHFPIGSQVGRIRWDRHRTGMWSAPKALPEWAEAERPQRPEYWAAAHRTLRPLATLLPPSHRPQLGLFPRGSRAEAARKPDRKQSTRDL